MTLHVIADPGFTFLHYHGRVRAERPDDDDRAAHVQRDVRLASVAEGTASRRSWRAPNPSTSTRVASNHRAATQTVEAPPPPPPASTDPGASGEPPVSVAGEAGPGASADYAGGTREARNPRNRQRILRRLGGTRRQPGFRRCIQAVNVRALQEQFRQYKSLKCTITGPPEFVQLDAVAGTAKVEVGVKQIIEMKSGGAPKTVETIAETTLLRPEDRSSWRIGNVFTSPSPSRIAAATGSARHALPETCDNVAPSKPAARRWAEHAERPTTR